MRKKKFLMLRGKLSGSLIVVSREWYESKRLGIRRGRFQMWKIAAQHDDKETLMAMARMTDRLKTEEVRHTTEEYNNVA
jgi:hypothetical protein